MDASKFDAWMKRILATEAEEISCSDCFDLLADYVEAEVAHRPVTGELLKVKQHLVQCRVCQEEHEILLDLVEMDGTKEDPGEGY